MTDIDIFSQMLSNTGGGSATNADRVAATPPRLDAMRLPSASKFVNLDGASRERFVYYAYDMLIEPNGVTADPTRMRADPSSFTRTPIRRAATAFALIVLASVIALSLSSASPVALVARYGVVFVVGIVGVVATGVLVTLFGVRDDEG